MPLSALRRSIITLFTYCLPHVYSQALSAITNEDEIFLKQSDTKLKGQ